METKRPDVSSDAAVTSSQVNPHASSHRLPTLSASQALQELRTKENETLETGVPALDQGLLGSRASSSPGGFERGKVSEVWGPCGAGKTSLIFQTASKALHDGGSVVWIDACTSLSNARIGSLLKPGTHDSVASSHSFHYISLFTLSHLLALILHPLDDFPSKGTSLLVIDGLATLVDLNFPRLPWTPGSKTEQQKWQAGRRYAVLGSLITGLNKLAVMSNMAVVVTTGCSTRIRSEYGLGAAIAPGIGGSEWEAGVWARIVIFRDFNGRLFGVQKSKGRNAAPLDPVGEVGAVVRFELTTDGSLHPAQVDRSPATQSGEPLNQSPGAASPTQPARKRFYEEIADSDDETADEYGWINMDEDVLATEGLVDEPGSEDPTNEDD